MKDLVSLRQKLSKVAVVRSLHPLSPVTLCTAFVQTFRRSLQSFIGELDHHPSSPFFQHGIDGK